MGSPVVYPFVYFRAYDSDGSPTDVFAAITFDSGYKMTTGLKPDINQGRMSPLELQKLGDNLTNPGDLCWYWRNKPEDDTDGSGAALTIQFVAIVDVQAVELGESPQLDSGVQVIAWRVYFSDWRDGLVFPRGGRLQWGMVNPTSTPPAANDPTADPPDPIQNSELIKRCFDAMGITAWATVPDGADDVAPVTNLNWHGTHAPSALADLMSKVGATFCPHLDGTASVEIIGEGDPPEPPDEDVIANLDIPVIDRRGKYVILTSAPTTKVSTKTIGGPSDDGWQFVVQDTSDNWVPINIQSAFDTVLTQLGIPTGTTPLAILNSSFALNYDPTNADAVKYHRRFDDQLYRCLRLNPDNYPPNQMPILRIVMEADGSTSVMSAEAIIAVQEFPGVFADSPMPIDLPIFSLENGSILHFADRLVKTNDNSDPSNTGFYMELYGGDPDGDGSDADLQIRVSMEMTEQDTDDAGNTIFRPDYYEVGFTTDADGSPQKMSDGDVKNAIDKPDRDTTFHWRPEWTDTLVWEVDGTETDHSKIDDAAKAEAKILLANLSQPSKEFHIRGFFACDTSGKIDEIQWLQKECKTVVKVGQHYRGGSHGLPELLGVEQ